VTAPSEPNRTYESHMTGLSGVGTEEAGTRDT
jgi:hypothetical protein